MSILGNSFRSCVNVLCNGFNITLKEEDQKARLPITLQDFFFPNESFIGLVTAPAIHKLALWEHPQTSLQPNLEAPPRDIICFTISNKYTKDSPFPWDDLNSFFTIQCIFLAFAHIPLQGVGLVLNLVNRIVKLVTFSYFWWPSTNSYSFRARIQEMGTDFSRVLATPFIFVILFFVSLYGVLHYPLHGAKIYAILEKYMYSGGYQILPKQEAQKTNCQGVIQPKASICSGFLAESFQPQKASGDVTFSQFLPKKEEQGLSSTSSSEPSTSPQELHGLSSPPASR